MKACTIEMRFVEIYRESARALVFFLWQAAQSKKCQHVRGATSYGNLHAKRWAQNAGTLRASLCNRHGCQHLRRATSYGNLQIKCCRSNPWTILWVTFYKIFKEECQGPAWAQNTDTHFPRARDRHAYRKRKNTDTDFARAYAVKMHIMTFYKSNFIRNFTMHEVPQTRMSPEGGNTSRTHFDISKRHFTLKFTGNMLGTRASTLPSEPLSMCTLFGQEGAEIISWNLTSASHSSSRLTCGPLASASHLAHLKSLHLLPSHLPAAHLASSHLTSLQVAFLYVTICSMCSHLTSSHLSFAFWILRDMPSHLTSSHLSFVFWILSDMPSNLTSSHATRSHAFPLFHVFTSYICIFILLFTCHLCTSYIFTCCIFFPLLNLSSVSSPLSSLSPASILFV